MVFTEKNNVLDQNTINSFRKYYRASQHVQFLNRCVLSEVMPYFCRISEKVNNLTQISSKERDSLEKRKLFNELEKQSSKTNLFKNHYENLKNYLFSNSNSNSEFLSLINNIETKVKRSELKCDTIRNNKFTELLRLNNPYYTKSKLINLTDITVPDEIQGLLELGPNNPIGGYVRNEGSEIFLGLDALFNKIKSAARKNNIDELNIESLRCNIMLTGRSLSICTTKDIRIEKFLQFKNEHAELIFMKCDKSKNICLLTLNDYFVKLQNLFSNNSDFFKNS